MPPIILLVAIVLAGCASPPPPKPAPAPVVQAPKAAPDRVVLLPNADGSTGSVVVRSSAGEQLIDKAYRSAEVGRDGVIALREEDSAAIQARYADVLAARPMAPISFTVNFRTGSDDLTPESQPEINKMRAELARRPAPEIVVIGHTDRVGRVEANDVLALRRAESVKLLLVKAGISSAQIETAGRGEREPLVPTADEVAEARNRRVEISVR